MVDLETTGDSLQERLCWFTAQRVIFTQAQDGTQSMVARLTNSLDANSVPLCLPLATIRIMGAEVDANGDIARVVVVQLEPHGTL